MRRENCNQQILLFIDEYNFPFNHNCIMKLEKKLILQFLTILIT